MARRLSGSCEKRASADADEWTHSTVDPRLDSRPPAEVRTATEPRFGLRCDLGGVAMELLLAGLAAVLTLQGSQAPVQTGRISGVVTEEGTNLPVAGAHVAVVNPDVLV